MNELAFSMIPPRLVCLQLLRQLVINICFVSFTVSLLYSTSILIRIKQLGAFSLKCVWILPNELRYINNIFSTQQKTLNKTNFNEKLKKWKAKLMINFRINNRPSSL